MRELIRAAWVIARRDFTAIIFSKSFFFFLLGPLFPVLVGVAAGSVGSQVSDDIARPIIAVVMSKADGAALTAAHADLAEKQGEQRMPRFTFLERASVSPEEISAILAKKEDGFVAVLSGTSEAPILTGTKGAISQWQGTIELLLSLAQSETKLSDTSLATSIVASSEGSKKRGQFTTAQVAQILLFLLTMLLAGMVLSNLVEEKTNKIIEILAAAIPIDAIFLGKLFAMLGMAVVGITVWVSVGTITVAMLGSSLPAMPAPAVGWPLFGLLGFLYFSMAYLLLGSLFLGIGAMAATVREVQTLSMPVTMGQMLVFFLASYSVTKLGEPIELFAAIFPFSSPFAMIARAAQMDELGQHILALGWQILFALLIIKASASLFRRNVMQSKGNSGTKKRGILKRLFRRTAP